MVGQGVSYLVIKDRSSLHIRSLVPRLVWARVLGSVVFTIYSEMRYNIAFHTAVLCLADFWKVSVSYILGYYNLLYSWGVAGCGYYI